MFFTSPIFSRKNFWVCPTYVFPKTRPQNGPHMSATAGCSWGTDPNAAAFWPIWTACIETTTGYHPRKCGGISRWEDHIKWFFSWHMHAKLVKCFGIAIDLQGDGITTFLYNKNAPPRKLTWQWKITIFNKRYIFKWWCVQCHVGFRVGIIYFCILQNVYNIYLY